MIKKTYNKLQRERRRLASQFARNNLLDSFIKRHLRKTKGLKAKQCTPHLIEKTRQRLINRRENIKINKKLSFENKCKCTKCEKIKLKDMFQKDSSKKCGIKKICKECLALYEKARVSSESRLRAMKKYRKKITKNLEDAYVRRLIATGTFLTHKDIPQALVDAKRQYMKINRITKERGYLENR